MGISKSILFNKRQNKVAGYARVFAHPARVAILEYLLKSNTCICGDLVNETGLAQATVSQHLKELKNLGLIKGTIEGTSVCYCIDEKKWGEVKGVFNTLFDKYRPTPGNCC